MQTHCSANQFTFQAFGSRSVSSAFDGGHITSDSGGLLLPEIEEGQRFLQRFSQCFTDLRNPKFVEHSVYELVSQRIYGLCFGNEDLNDHDLPKCRGAYTHHSRDQRPDAPEAFRESRKEADERRRGQGHSVALAVTAP